MKTRRGKHLTYEERLSIERWYNRDKLTKVAIALLLDRTEKTIRNEIKRGMTKNLTSELKEIYVYSADISQKRYEFYLQGKGGELKIGNDYKLKTYIEKSIIVDKKSPEVIAYEIKSLEFTTELSARTIRNYIYKGSILDISTKQSIYNKKKKQKNPKKTVCSKVPPEKSIEYRPQEANTRDIYGHWEGDLVIGKKQRSSVLLTFTERKTREEIIIKLPNKESENVSKALDMLENKYKNKFYTKFKSITFDNGVEFRNWQSLEKSYKSNNKRTIIYYAHPYRSGERGSNENNNKLIRRFLPKGTNFDNISNEYIEYIQEWINNYPRLIFNYKTAKMMSEKNFC